MFDPINKLVGFRPTPLFYCCLGDFKYILKFTFYVYFEGVSKITLIQPADLT